VPGIQFVSLQYDVSDEDRGYLKERLGDRIIFDDSLRTGEDMAGWMSQAAAMDLVLSVSTTTAHLAGASSTPVWTALAKLEGLFWFWFLERTDSPWYPSMHLYRQTTQGDWSDVMAPMAADLAQKFGSSE